jgi:putative FmdB family regulatory protein
MPFYEYQCKACGAHHEAMQKMSDAPLKKCPACGKSQLVRLISAPVFRLKGGGWYETDFKSDKETKRNLAGEEKGEKSDLGETKAETKPETKAEPKSEAKAAAAATKPSKVSKAAKPAKARAAAKRPAKKAARGR